MFFYELHEGDDDVYSDALVVSESEWEPDEFFQLVQRIRRDLQDGYDQGSLIEAIATVLDRDHGFVFVSDDRLRAAVNVSTLEADNFLADLDANIGVFDDDDDDDDDDEDEEPRGDYRTILTEVDFELDAERERRSN